MIRSAIIFYLVNYCAFLFSQNYTLSRSFPASGKNVPLEIINNHPEYFYLLRYNRAVHDITLERRAKPSAEILKFTPLGLDSVNASWFNYEKLDHLFFEKNNSIFFFFEKVLNAEKFLFLKVVDTVGKTSGFIELLHLKVQKPVVSVQFRYKLTEEKNILIIATQYYGNNYVKNVVYLYDPSLRKMVVRKSLPPESEESGYSEAYSANARGDIFYAVVKSQVVSTKRRYIDHMQVEIPVFFFESVSVAALLKENDLPFQSIISTNLTALHSISLASQAERLVINLHYSAEDSAGIQNVYFLNQARTKNLIGQLYSVKTKLATKIESQLTYYDGTDFNSPADKDFRLLTSYKVGDDVFIFSHRKDKDYFKEVLLCKINDQTGVVIDQQIIPRKTSSYDDRTHYKSMGVVTFQICKNRVSAYLLENRRNLKTAPDNYKFTKFARQRQLPTGVLVRYSYGEDGILKKEQIFSNESIYTVPLKYHSDQCDFIFYLSKGAIEKFAFLKANP